MGEFPAVQTLHLHTLADCWPLLDRMPDCTTLQELSLGLWKCTQADLRYVMAAFRDQPLLTSLMLYNTSWNAWYEPPAAPFDLGRYHLLNDWTAHTQLQSLHLRDIDVSTSDVIEMSTLQLLTSLVFVRIPKADDVTITILLRSLPNLCELQLTDCDLNLSSLWAACKQATQLRSLDISGAPPLHQSDLQHFVPLRQLTHLVLLNDQPEAIPEHVFNTWRLLMPALREVSLP